MSADRGWLMGGSIVMWVQAWILCVHVAFSLPMSGIKLIATYVSLVVSAPFLDAWDRRTVGCGIFLQMA